MLIALSATLIISALRASSRFLFDSSHLIHSESSSQLFGHTLIAISLSYNIGKAFAYLLAIFLLARVACFTIIVAAVFAARIAFIFAR